MSSTMPTAAAPPTTRTTLTKLQTQDLPRLSGNSPKPIDTALWIRQMVRWSHLNSLTGYLEGTPPTHPDPQINSDCIRYISAGIESDSLRGILADQAFLTSQDAFQFIKDRWLNGVSESTIFKQKMATSVFSDDRGIQAYAADFNLWHRHISPSMPTEEAAECFDTSLPEKFEAFCLSARQNPGISSMRTGKSISDPIDHIKSFMAYTDRVAALIMNQFMNRGARPAHLGRVLLTALLTP